jgi:hypothetical protein
MSRAFETQQLFDIQVLYDILPEEGDLPQQVDITSVAINVINPTTGKVRKVQVLGALSESDVINLEDEIQENLS